MTNFKSKSFITAGFITILLILLAVMVLWINDVTTFRERLQYIVMQEHEREIVADMRDSVYRRSIALHRMTEFDDPFDRDEEFIKYREMGDLFLTAREKLLATDMNELEKAAWEKSRVILNKGGAAQNQVVVLLSNDDLKQARNVLLQDVVPTQDTFISEITNLFDIKGAAIDLELATVTNESSTSLLLIVLLGAAAMLLAGFTIFVVRRTGKTEDALMEQGERISSLYQVSAMTGVTPDEQIQEMLKLGCRLLNLSFGKVSHIETKNNINRVINFYSSRDIKMKKGTVIPLDQTFCYYAFPDDKPFAIDNISQSKYCNYSCYIATGFESYIAVPIWIHGEKFGTVSFACISPRKDLFSKTDKDLVNLIGSWISVTLEREISQDELLIAKEDAEKATVTKSLFLAKMSHELRTPLNAIIGYSEMLKEDAEEHHHDAYVPDLDKISSSGTHLLYLINDILDLTKIEAGKMELLVEDVDVKGLIEDVSQTVLPLIRRNKNYLKINCESDLGFIKCDKTRIKQVLLNLLSNACKFTEDGDITLDARKITHDGKTYVSLNVIDTGIGIDDNHINKIFQDFSQADPSTASKYGGTGLGLTISKQICQLMGGNISMKSEFGKGSTFTVTLPSFEVVDDHGNGRGNNSLRLSGTG